MFIHIGIEYQLDLFPPFMIEFILYDQQKFQCFVIEISNMDTKFVTVFNIFSQTGDSFLVG